jgi:signal transduction histidine kinase
VAGADAALNPTAGELQSGFEAFIAAARRLEQSYAELTLRAAAVDLELQRTNERLQRALAERDAVFAAMPLGVVAWRGDGSVAFANDEAARLLARARAQGVDLAAAAGDVDVGEGAVRVARAALPDGDLLLLEDRSRLCELEREVRRLDRLAGLSELALGIAHEIKNPLNGAMGFASLLERAPDGAAAARYAAAVREGLGQVDGIVRSLLAFARPGQRCAATAPVAAIVDEAAAAAGLPRARVELRGDGALRAESDAVRVLAVLLRNAGEAAGAAVRVRVSAQAAAGRLELVVEDNGPGVPAALGDRVFEPFVSGKPRGTGLGLPLAARVLSFLGGDVALLNPGQPGARFRVRMPLARPAPSPAEADA